MSVCIAVWPRFTDTFVLVTDQLLSTENASVDGAMKMGVFAPVGQWTAMFSGDAHRFSPLMNRVREFLGDVRNSRLMVDSVHAAIQKAYEVEILGLIESEILRPYGVSRDEFIAKGRQWLGDTRFNLVMDQVSAMDLGIELLVVGLDVSADPQMFTVSSKGAITPSVLRYDSIGIGAPTALGTFYQLKHFPTFDLADTIYRALAAKFSAEHVPGVGHDTHALLVESLSGVWTLVTDVDRLREIWEREGQPPFPPKARRLVAQEVRKLRKAEGHATRVAKRRRKE